MWEGCGKSFAATQMSSHGHRTVGNSLQNLRQHEAQHTKGDAEAFNGFECPEADCTHKEPTSAAVWTHASEAHGIEEDTCRCLWVRCGKHFSRPSDYRKHEGVHTGVFPFTCSVCGKGHGQSSSARACCAVSAACRCGKLFKGRFDKRNFASHEKKCKMGAAPLPASTAAPSRD